MPRSIKDAFLRDFETLTATGDGIVANTIEEAAAFIGCSVEDLQNTIDTYNGYVKAGKDDQFFKSAEDLLWTVEEGPFYVTKGYNAVLGALGGVNTNELLQVVDSTNTPISGLYATGNNVSGMSVAAYVNIEGTGGLRRPAAVLRARMPPRRASNFVPFQRSSGLKPDGLFSSFPP